MSALHDGDWQIAEASSASHRSHASGLVAAHLQWHLERTLRTLPLVERPQAGPGRALPSDHTPLVHGGGDFRQDVAHGDGPGGQLLAGG